MSRKRLERLTFGKLHETETGRHGWLSLTDGYMSCKCKKVAG